MDGKIGAKRVEWSFKDSGMVWGPVEKVDDPALTCESNLYYAKDAR